MGRFAKFILAGRYNAIFVTGFFGAMSLFLLPLSIFSGAAVALVVLRTGLVKAIFVLAVSALLIQISLILSPAKPGFPFPVVFALWAPVLAGAWWLRNTASQSKALMAIGTVCSLFVVGMYIAVGDVVAWWNEWILTAMPGVRDSSTGESGAEDTIRLANGFVAMLLGLGSMFTLLFARWMQATLFNPGGFAAEFIAIKLPRTILVGILVLLIVSSFFNQQMMTDLFMVAIMVYFFTGIAVLHGIVVRRRLNRNWLVAPYLGLIFLPYILIPGLAILGVADSFIDFRSRK
ncbi:MAG: DUF2232 domain-containing protein [Methylococcales bacterium]